MRDGEIVVRFDEEPLDFVAAVTAMLGHCMTEADLSFKIRRGTGT